MPPSRKPGSTSRTTVLILIVVLSMVAALISLSSSTLSNVQETLPAAAVVPGKTIIEIGTTWVAADVAMTEADRARGLSGRESLGEREGLLFIHPSSGQHAYWMKDMKFPIDIIWINPDRRIVDLTTNLLPETYPGTVAPRSPVLYVLEVPAGFVMRNNISIGDSVAF